MPTHVHRARRALSGFGRHQQTREEAETTTKPNCDNRKQGPKEANPPSKHVNDNVSDHDHDQDHDHNHDHGHDHQQQQQQQKEIPDSDFYTSMITTTTRGPQKTTDNLEKHRKTQKTSENQIKPLKT